MTDPLPIAFPAPPGSRTPPVWTGREFRSGEESSRILSYDLADSGWTDELTLFQEEHAGADHYIDQASRDHTLACLCRHLRRADPVIIDIGCSSGFMLKDLRQAFPGARIVGADYVRGPLEALGRELPDLPLLQFDLTTCPLPSASFDAVVLLNVLEHIADDGAALRQVARVLKPGGVAVIEVPAGPNLYDIYDKQLLHHRRYRMSGLLREVEGAGLAVLERSHLGFFFYPGFWLIKKNARRHLHENHERQRALVTRSVRAGRKHPLMHAVMRLEAKLRPFVYYPCGIRCLVTCRKI